MRAILKVACSLALAGGLAGCGGGHQAEVNEGGPPVAVRTETVRMTQVPVIVTAVGTTEPFARATPGTKLMGRVREVTVSEGDRVSKGDVLVRIEDRDLAAKRGQAASGLREARAVLENAETMVKRIRNLYRENAVSKQKLDEAETAYARTQAGAAAAEGMLREVEANLAYSSVASPLDGVVVRKFVQAGDMAAPGAPLFTVEQQDPMKVVVEVNEGDLVYVRVDSPVVVHIEALRGGSTRSERVGKVEAVVPSANPGSRTFQVKVVLPNPSVEMQSGMFARVGFQKGERPGILVPSGAVVREGQLHGVYVISGDRARLRWVRLGKAFGERTEVISGLEPGDRVVKDGLDRVSDGSRVEVTGDV